MVLAAELFPRMELLPLNHVNGSGIPIVFLHGWASQSLVWLDLVKELEAQGVTDRAIYALDLPGFGHHCKQPMGSLEDFVSSIENILPSRCLLIGWSLGGMVASQIAARKNIHVTGLVTIATNVSYVQSDGWPSAMPHSTFDEFYQGFQTNTETTLKRFIGLQALGDAERKKVSTKLMSMLAYTDSQKTFWLKGLDYLKQLNNFSELKKISTPVLHILGEQDKLVPVSTAEQIKKHYADHRVCVLPRLGHVPHISQPDIVAQAIVEFLRSESSATPQKEKKKIADSFSKAAKTYDKAAALQKCVADKMMHLIPDGQDFIVDLGCGTGYCTEQLSKKNGNSVVGMDIAAGMIEQAKTKCRAQWVLGDIENLPFAYSSINGFVSSLSVQWCESIEQVFVQIYDTLKDNGFFLFSTLGPKTLHELNTAWRHADSGNHVHVNQFVDSDYLTEAILRSGLSVDIFMREEQVFHYQTVVDLMRDLKNIGAHNINSGRNLGLTGRKKLAALTESYECFRREEDNTLPATYEVYYYLLKK